MEQLAGPGRDRWRRMARPPVVALWLVAGMASALGAGACSSTEASPDATGTPVVDADPCTADAGGTVCVIAGCKVPASLTGTDFTSGQCQGASRAVLSCPYADGTTQICLSNDTTCHTGYSDTSGNLTCVNKCGASEFGIVCGSVGPGPAVSPPPGCRSVLLTPGGVAFYCCGCGA